MDWKFYQAHRNLYVCHTITNSTLPLYSMFWLEAPKCTRLWLKNSIIWRQKINWLSHDPHTEYFLGKNQQYSDSHMIDKMQ